ncbi:S8 family serine peptidase [Actinomadura gamaensis]|uniref:S8 family serine peptidase n=1 Tax=Actinomadura gamaensis TaxID=1763541 RepID=A0ABV9U6C5_9ACTN
MLTVRAWHRLMAAALASAAALGPLNPAAAAGPAPREDEWWFRTWPIQDKIWPVTRGGGVTIALLDSGVNARLPELSGAVLPGADLVDQSTDGRVDLDTESPGHGTATAAQMVGQGGGSSGYLGVAPGARVLPIRIPETALTGDVLAKAITTAVDRGAKVVNMSFVQDSAMFTPVHCDPQLAPAITYALRHDVILVAGAGNTGDQENGVEQPASCPGVLGIGALTRQLRPWSKTQRQNYVTLAAPGADLSLVDKHGVIHGGAGTSSAAGLTSAAIALIRAKNPTMPARVLVQRLFATARPIGGSGWNERAGFGLIDLVAAIDPAHHPVPASASNPLYDAFDRWQGQAASVSPGPNSSPASPHSAPALRKRSSMSRGLWILVAVITALTSVALAAGIGIVRFRRTGRTS